MMALLSMAELPGGGYCCQSAMFAVLLRQGFCVPAAFAGVMMGFAAQYAMGTLAGCWQLPVCTLLWLSAGAWTNPTGRITMAAAEFAAQLTAAAVTGIGSLYAIAVTVLTAAAGAGLSVLYDGAALSVSRRDELDGDTRPLCILAVCASLAVGLASVSGGQIPAAALAMYLTLEHAYIGGASQAILCAGIMGGVVSLAQGSPQTLAMLLAGGFLAGEIKTSRKSVTVLLMLCGMAVGTTLMGGDMAAIRRMLFALPGVFPFLILSGIRRSGIACLIEQD
ncbi:MAG: hypothetical protein UD963_07600, partial [Christensenellales bacterium]|nr:hypothetical protein [Christensenellales bacterium]